MRLKILCVKSIIARQADGDLGRCVGGFAFAGADGA
jgi:hypothetical protein